LEKNDGKHGEEDGYWMQGRSGGLKNNKFRDQRYKAKSEAEQVSLEL